MSSDKDWRTRAEILPALFGTDAQFWAGKRAKYSVSTQQVGVVHVPTGRIVTSAAITTLDFAPLARQTPTGDFPVEVSIAKPSKGDTRIAAVRVTFSPQPIASWERAPEGDYKGTLGIIMDVETIPHFQSFRDAHGVEWDYDVKFVDGKTWQHACLQPSEANAANCALFTCGEYEGTYLSYWALDSRGEPVMLVTDFNIIP